MLHDNGLGPEYAYSDVSGGSFVLSFQATVGTGIHIAELIVKFLRG